jgi:hypothetical protein
MNQKLKKKDLDRTGDVGIEDSVVIAIHSHKRDGATLPELLWSKDLC